ncbi:flavin reductase family protein [Nocardia sp. NBC_01388]|uniref:flavin reductase family protein n=1 Tax=Nocardia sp. NBC_01388 TaxID=2903596 RepID=UPI00324F1B3D
MVFREAMARFPSGVTIVTALDERQRPHGFTASSLCSVSADPPLILVCLANSARCFPVFSTSSAFTVNILGTDQTVLARTFASGSADKFAEGAFRHSPQGGLSLDGAVAVLDCTVHEQYPAGDHTIIVGAVTMVDLGERRDPAVYWDRRFTRVCASETMPRPLR